MKKFIAIVGCYLVAFYSSAEIHGASQLLSQAVTQPETKRQSGRKVLVIHRLKAESGNDEIATQTTQWLEQDLASNFKIITSETMAERLKQVEQQQLLGSCKNEKCDAEILQNVGGDLILAGNIKRRQEKIIITAKLINAEAIIMAQDQQVVDERFFLQNGRPTVKILATNLYAYYAGLKKPDVLPVYRFNSSPARATIEVDNVVQCRSTPCDWQPLAPLQYTIKVSADGYYPHEEMIEVKRGKDNVIEKNIQLKSNTIEIRITSEPIRARVKITGGKSCYTSCSLTLEKDRNYDVTVTHSEYETLSASKVAEEDNEWHFTLTKKEKRVAQFAKPKQQASVSTFLGGLFITASVVGGIGSAFAYGNFVAARKDYTSLDSTASQATFDSNWSKVVDTRMKTIIWSSAALGSLFLAFVFLFSGSKSNTSRNYTSKFTDLSNKDKPVKGELNFSFNQSINLNEDYTKAEVRYTF